MSSLSTKEAIELCKSKGTSITKTALRQNGIRFGFMYKSDNGFHWLFDKNGLLKYLERKEKAPVGYVTINSLAKKYGVSLSTVYYQIRVWKIQVIECGASHWKYVNEKEYIRKKWKHRKITLMG